MYENMGYEVILARMLDRVPPNMDKREGSIIYDALAPAAGELQMIYLELDRAVRESFADTQSRDYLILRAAERGITPKEASAAIRRGNFNMAIPLGTRFSLGELTYAVFEKIEDKVYKLACETYGAAGNAESGTMLPIDFVDGLTVAELTEVLVPGENEEETEVFRSRYFASLNAQAFGGNIADYQSRVGAMQGVGGVKVIPVWNGAGTVKIIILDSDFAVPSAALVSFVQEELDPTKLGNGVGIAPIGHVCTVVGAEAIPINITTNIVLHDDWVWEDIAPYAQVEVENYFKSLAASWGNLKAITVRISQIETRLLDLPGVLDISDTKINNSLKNLVLADNKIPIRGTVNVISVTA